MPFPYQDQYWLQVRSFLEQHAKPLDPILAPNEFLEFFPGTYHYNVSYLLPADQFEFVLFHKGMVEEVEYPLAAEIMQRFHPVFANAVFVVYAKHPIPDLEPLNQGHFQTLLDQIKVIRQFVQPVEQQSCAAVITTYNRPQRLERSLPQILDLGIPVVVVDDASEPEQATANQQIADRFEVPLIRIPENRGLPNAINAGVNYWLADPDLQWISYFQDDVDVHPDTIKILTQVQDARDRPLLTGREAEEHLTFETGTVAGYPVLYKRSMPGVHLHAHRSYWMSVMPIPTPYLGAPKPDRGKPGQGADEDWWITAWSPQAVSKQGGYVVCVPGLVRTFDQTGEDSTWNNLIPLEPEAIAAIAHATPATPTAIAPPSADQVERPSLEGLRVLVDGYNLELSSGTGIKTYGTSLIKALTLMEAQVDVLLSRSGDPNNPVLDEVLFFDDQASSKSRLLEILGLVKGMIRASSGPLYRARKRQTTEQLVIKQGRFSEDFLKYAESFNLSQCYKIADALFQFFKKVSDIHIDEKIDIWHATYPLPIRIDGAKKITTVHDLIPLRMPYTTLDNKANFYYKVRNALRDSSVVITVSENSKQDILNYFDTDPDKIVVTYQPIVLEPFSAEEAETTPDYLKRFQLDYQRYILFVGAIEPKKNVGRLLDAYAALDTDMPLVLVGKKAWSWEDELGRLQYLFTRDSQGSVKMLEYVSGESLRHLYQGAYCFVFPSLYEGFGLPPLEAMSFGCPVLTSRTSCLPEICGNAALYVDPYDVGDIKQKLEKLVGDRQLRDELASHSHAIAARFRMDNYLKRLHQAYTQAL